MVCQSSASLYVNLILLSGHAFLAGKSLKLALRLQERKSIRPSFSAEGIFGGTLLAIKSSEFIVFYDWQECRLIRRIDVDVKVRANTLVLELGNPRTSRRRKVLPLFGTRVKAERTKVDVGGIVQPSSTSLIGTSATLWKAMLT